MKNEKLIIDNRSSKPLYEGYEKAFLGRKCAVSCKRLCQNGAADGSYAACTDGDSGLFNEQDIKIMEWKFRGYDAVGSKCWVYGDLVHDKKVTVTGLEDRVKVGGYEVVPESVGLWTGLHDKNGKEVFDGDILLFKDLGCLWEDQVVVVKWSDFAAGFETGGFNIRLCTDNEIIGNVYQNKELLNNEQGN